MVELGTMFSSYGKALIDGVRRNRPEKYSHAVSLVQEAQLFDFSFLNLTPKSLNIDFSECQYHVRADKNTKLFTVQVPFYVYDFKFGLPFWSSYVLLERKDSYSKALQFEERHPDMYYGTTDYHQPSYNIGVGFVAFYENSSWYLNFTLDNDHLSTIASIGVPEFNPEWFCKRFSEDIALADYLFSKISDYYYAIEEKATLPFYAKPLNKKTSSSVRIQGKPVYILLEEKKSKNKRCIEKLEKKYPKYKILHSFPVRGHWRRLSDPNSIGKDRHGEYNQRGFTWVKECIKGSGELISKRPYIVLSKRAE